MKKRFLGLAAILATAAIPALGAPADHLLISEVSVRGGLYISGGQSPEYIEIYNPTASPVFLGDYLITDWSEYWRYPDYVRRNELPNEGTGDFVQRFPDDSIEAGKVVVATANAKQFLLTFFNHANEAEPDLTALLANFTSQPGNPVLYESTDSMPEVPNMINLNADTSDNSTNQSHTDGGENIFLVYYDGTSDLVKDVDMFLYKKRGALSGTENGLYPKSDPVDGPDGDEIATAYQPDNGSEDNLSFNFVDSAPYQLVRTMLFEPGETNSGGNGLTGHDETTEFIQVSFAGTPTTATATPGTPDPRMIATVRKPVIFGGNTTPEIPASTDAITITSEIHDEDGTVTSADLYVSDGLTTTPYVMTNSAGNTWTATIPASSYPDHTLLSWYIVAEDNDSNVTSEWEYADFGTVGDPVIHTVRIDNNPVLGNVVVNEIMFDPSGGDNSTNPEFFELYNKGSVAYDLTGYSFQYNATTPFVFPTGTIIGPDDYLVFVHNLALFNSKYTVDPSKVLLINSGATNSQMANSGTGNIRIFAWDGTTEIDIVSYRVTPPWPGNTVSGSGFAASNTGYSIELLDPSIENNDGASWIVSSQRGTEPAGGTPGENNFSIDCVRNLVSPTPSDPIIITALVAGTHPATNVQLTYTINEGAPVTVPMAAVPSSNNFSYTFPAQAEGTFIRYNVTAEDTIDSVNITANPIDYSFVVTSQPLLSEDNIAITEILPNPAGNDNETHSEFLELYNRTGSPLSLSHALVGPNNANIVEIPHGYTLPPYGWGVIAGNKASFMVDYPDVDEDIVIDAGWTVSRLGQTGTPVQIAIYDPNQLQLNRTNFTALTLQYGLPGDGWPYGNGESMMLIDVSLDRNVASSWENGPDGGTPGQASAVRDWSVY